MNLLSNNCICKASDFKVVYAQKLNPQLVGAYEYSARRVRKIQHYRIVKCNACGLTYSNPVFPESSLAQFYKDSKFLYGTESDYACRTYYSLIAPYLKLFNNKALPRLLEIGCGDGSFLRQAANNGIEVRGVEPSVEAVTNAAIEIKGKIINDIFRPEEFGADCFNIICSFHVIDHLSDPLRFAKDSYKVLKKSGIFILVCHNVDALVNKILGDRSPVFDVEHIYLFNKKTISALLRNAGFKVIGLGAVKNTYPVSYWLRYMPLLNKSVDFLPNFLRSASFSAYAGNIFICGQKI